MGTSASVTVRRGEEKIAQILQAARSQFLRQGYSGTSMDDVALAANVSKPTLYVYFGSKRDLFGAVIDHERERYGRLMLVGERGREHIRVKLLRIGRAIVDFLLSEETIASYRMVVAEAGRLPEAGRTFYANGPVKFLDRLQTFVAKCMQDGALRVGDPRRAAGELIGLVRGDLQLRALLGLSDEVTAVEIDSAVRSGIDTFYRAYRP